jgi:Type I phosphodiesterase / nucleotide pyrophosphatase
VSAVRLPRTLVVFVLLGGLAAALVTALGSIAMGLVAGISVAAAGWLVVVWAARRGMLGDPADPSRRRFLVASGVGGLAWAVAGIAIGRAASKLARPDAAKVQGAAATGLGAEYMELLHRTYHPARSGDLQLLLAPFNSSNYPNESLSLVPNDPRTSHASVWMYLERIPLLVHGPGIVEPSDSVDRVTLADLAPTTAHLIGFDGWPAAERDGVVLPGLRTNGTRPKVVVTFVIDGGGWNVLKHWSDDWPNLKRLMGESANYRNAITGSFPAVTACAHANIGTGAFPSKHGITGHNIRDGAGARKTYGHPGKAQPSDIAIPTLADLWHDETQAWVGEIGYQVWHLGMLGRGGTARPEGDKPVGVFWDEDGTRQWQPHNPALYRLPDVTPGLDVLAQKQALFVNPGWDAGFAPQGRQAPCCSPPIVEYQGDLIRSTFASEAIGEGDTASLLYINYKSPDYTGHIYNMLSDWESLMLRTVDNELGSLVRDLDERFPGEYVLIVTADHGQCPLPDSVDGVRLDPIQLERVIEERFGAGLTKIVEYTAPSEVWIDSGALWDAGATLDDVAAHLQGLTYRQNIGPYVPRDAVEQDMLDRPEFAGVFAGTWLQGLRETSGFGAGSFKGDDIDPGIPTI